MRCRSNIGSFCPSSIALFFSCARDARYVAYTRNTVNRNSGNGAHTRHLIKFRQKMVPKTAHAKDYMGVSHINKIVNVIDRVVTPFDHFWRRHGSFPEKLFGSNWRYFWVEASVRRRNIVGTSSHQPQLWQYAVWRQSCMEILEKALVWVHCLASAARILQPQLNTSVHQLKQLQLWLQPVSQDNKGSAEPCAVNGWYDGCATNM